MRVRGLQRAGRGRRPRACACGGAPLQMGVLCLSVTLTGHTWIRKGQNGVTFSGSLTPESSIPHEIMFVIGDREKCGTILGVHDQAHLVRFRTFHAAR